jgi:hypothetical protein
MQARPPNKQQVSTNQRAVTVATSTLLCFGLAGLIFGFAFGGFIGRSPGSSTASAKTPTASAPVISNHSPGVTATATPENVLIDTPSIGAGDYSTLETADGTTSYTFSAQILDKTTHQPIQATDVTCKLWLTDNNAATSDALKANNYAIPANVTNLNQAFPHETQGAFTFTSSTQVQACAANGKTTWTYTLSPTLKHGTYFLAVLADWKGKHYNWYLVQISVAKASN